MKLYIFSFFVTIYMIQVFGYITTYPGTAQGLKFRIGFILNQLNASQNNLDKKLLSVEKKTFYLDRNPIIVSLKKAMKRKESKNGYEDCDDLLTTGKAFVLKYLRDIGRDGLKQAYRNVTNQKWTIQQIKANLSGPDLVQQIRLCQRSPPKCNLTGTYPKTIEEVANYLRNNFEELTAYNVTDRIIRKKVPRKVLLDKLNTEIADPVNSCLGTL